jgi:hypothetical protein
MVTLADCFAVKPPYDWHIRAIYNVASEARFAMILNYLRLGRSSQRFEARAFAIEDVPRMAPLIVNGYDVILATSEHGRYFRVDKSLHLTGRAAASAIEESFDQLWYNERAFRLRSQAGNNLGEISRLATRLDLPYDTEGL